MFPGKSEGRILTPSPTLSCFAAPILPVFGFVLSTIYGHTNPHPTEHCPAPAVMAGPKSCNYSGACSSRAEAAQGSLQPRQRGVCCLLTAGLCLNRGIPQPGSQETITKGDKDLKRGRRERNPILGWSAKGCKMKPRRYHVLL